MSKQRSVLIDLSAALAAQAAAAANITVAISTASGRHLSGMLWQADAVVTSAQSLPREAEYEISSTNHGALKGNLAGRDPGTNIAALRLERALPFTPPQTAEASPGAIALAVGEALVSKQACASGSSTSSGRSGVVVGAAESTTHTLDTRLESSEEGGPVWMAPVPVGISTFGPRDHPSDSERHNSPRSAGVIRDGYIARGWLGLGLQPVAVPDALRNTAV